MDIKKINLLGVVLACLASCTNDELVETNNLPNDGQTATVKFEMNANTGNYSPLSRSINLPAITKANFRIMAFKKSNDSANEGYYYAQDVPTDNMKYENSTLSGIARLPIGDYKFVSTYGLVNGGFQLPELTPVITKLTDDLRITHETVDGSSVIFLEKGSLADLPSYQLGINPEANQPVSTELGRGVARVDILFLQSTKDDEGVYTEVSEYEDVLETTNLESIVMKFTNLNNNVNLVGQDIKTDPSALFNNNFTVPDLTNTITIGNSEANTQVGTSGFRNYDAITAADIKKGSAHVHGSYLLPCDAATTTGLTLVLKNKKGDLRTINASAELPLERNKVTIVKIHVLSGTVFNTDVKFNVTIDTEWLEAKTVDGEIS